MNKAIVDIRLRPRCALPSPPSQPIGRIACAQNFTDSYFRLHGILNDSFCWIILLHQTRQRRYCTCLRFPQNCPFPLGDRILHLIRSTYGLPESSAQTASRSVQPFVYESQMLCCTMHCHWEENPQNCPFPMGFHTLPEEDRATATGNSHQVSHQVRLLLSNDQNSRTPCHLCPNTAANRVMRTISPWRNPSCWFESSLTDA